MIPVKRKTALDHINNNIRWIYKKRKTEAYVFPFWLTDLENLEHSIKENTDESVEIIFLSFSEMRTLNIRVPEGNRSKYSALIQLYIQGNTDVS